MNQLRMERVRIGERLRQAREGAGFTKEEAADAADVQSVALDAWERGKSMPCLIQFRSLIALYGVTGYQVLFGENPFEMTRSEACELSQLVRSGSPSLQLRVELMLTMLAQAGADRAAAGPRH